MTTPPLAPRTATASGTRGACVAPHTLATTAGLEVLAAGGTAADAAIAASAVLTVVTPDACGLGGDAFWLIWDEASQTQVALNGSGRSASAASSALLRGGGLEHIPWRGPLAITIPGLVRSWRDVHARYGALPVAALLSPAMRAARDGFEVGAPLASVIGQVAAALPDEPWASGFHATFQPAGRSPAPSDTLRQPALATTLSELVDDGFDALYDGRVGAALIAALSKAGAPFSPEDLRTHASDWCAPIEATYRGVRVTTAPPNSSGVFALQALKILERLEPPDRGTFADDGWQDARWVHYLLEAAKVALVDRDARLTDPRVDATLVDHLLDPERLARQARLIAQAGVAQQAPPVRRFVGGTAYVAAVDEAGNAVSLILSHGSAFGSGVVDAATGVTFHGRGASFSLRPGHPNELAPSLRPAHSLLPGMLFRGEATRPWIVAGSMGGDIQPQIHTQLVSALVDGEAPLGLALAGARIAVQPQARYAPPLEVRAEPWTRPDLLEDLRARGHEVSTDGVAFLGHQHAIELVDGGPAANGRLLAGTDPRTSGLPATR